MLKYANIEKIEADNKIILYHGNSAVLKHPEIKQVNLKSDFGNGFYLTSSIEQAKHWAFDKSSKSNTETPVVSCFELNIEEFTEAVENKYISIKGFRNSDKEWLDFVRNQRSENSNGSSFDLVIGPVADDLGRETLRLYEMGIYDEKRIINFFIFRKLADQWCFKNKNALQFLCFVKAYEIKEDLK